jgi:hypothetical protein
MINVCDRHVMKKSYHKEHCFRYGNILFNCYIKVLFILALNLKLLDTNMTCYNI